MEMQGVAAYDLTLLSCDFEEFISQYRSYEDRVLVSVVEFLTARLEKLGYESHGDIFLIEGVPFRLLFESGGVGRIATFMLIPRIGSVHDMEQGQLEINHFGWIRTLSYKWPTRLSKQTFDLLGKEIVARIRNQYIALEVAFRNKYSSLNIGVMRNLYELLTISLLQADLKHVVSQCWFSVTNRSTNKFYYHFHSEQVAALIEHLKSHQTDEYSPFELLASLIIDEVDDSIYASGSATSSGFISIPFIQLLTEHQNDRFWLAEHELFEDTDLSALEICTHNDYSLQLNCPTSSSQAVQAGIGPVQEILAKQFAENIKSYASLRRLLAGITKRVKDSPQYSALRDFAAEVLSRTIVKSMKPH